MKGKEQRFKQCCFRLEFRRGKIWSLPLFIASWRILLPARLSWLLKFIQVLSWLFCLAVWCEILKMLRATSHTRLRARDHFTSSTLIGGKGGAGQVRFIQRLRDHQSKWMQDGCSLHGFLHGIKWVMFHGHYFEKSSLAHRPNTILGDHDTPKIHICWFIIFKSCVRILYE